jgi:hypothetical protein
MSTSGDGAGGGGGASATGEGKGAGKGTGTGGPAGSTDCFATYGAAFERSCLRDLEGVFPMLHGVPELDDLGQFNAVGEVWTHRLRRCQRQALPPLRGGPELRLHALKLVESQG